MFISKDDYRRIESGELMIVNNKLCTTEKGRVVQKEKARAALQRMGERRWIDTNLPGLSFLKRMFS